MNIYLTGMLNQLTAYEVKKPEKSTEVQHNLMILCSSVALFMNTGIKFKIK